LKIKYQK